MMQGFACTNFVDRLETGLVTENRNKVLSTLVYLITCCTSELHNANRLVTNVIGKIRRNEAKRKTAWFGATVEFVGGEVLLVVASGAALLFIQST